ncbi:MAG: serine/threonine-protein kinase [Chloroflexi bacterium]|nr:serine/threonine-protein kinase [Chloroflexota bacterium]
MANRLQHPNILPLYDSGEADGLLFYVIPLVDGPSRQLLLESGEGLPVSDAVRVLRDVADALTEARANGVVHRDIKPENVLLRGRHALVTDFGVAKALSEAAGRGRMTTAGVVLGTLAYMSPEQAESPDLDHRVDLYAVGVMGYELPAGRLPFTGVTVEAVLAQHLTAAPVPIRDLRPPLAAVILKCLAKRLADRW